MTKDEQIEKLIADKHKLRDAVRVAIVELYNQHPADVLKTFSFSELENIVEHTEKLRPRQVEDIYREALELA